MQKGAKSIKVCTAYTNVAVILLGIIIKITSQHPNIQHWVAFGKEKCFDTVILTPYAMNLERRSSLFSLSFMLVQDVPPHLYGKSGK